jgi:hypothetical protein
MPIPPRTLHGGATLLTLILAAAPTVEAQVEVGGRLGATRANVVHIECSTPCVSTRFAAPLPTDRIGVMAGGYVQWQAERGRAFRVEALRVTRGNEAVHSVHLELPLVVEWTAPLHPRLALRGHAGVAPSLLVTCTDHTRVQRGRVRPAACDENTRHPPPDRDLGVQLGSALWVPVEGGGFSLEFRFSRGIRHADGLHEARTLSLSHGQTLRLRSGS